MIITINVCTIERRAKKAAALKDATVESDMPDQTTFKDPGPSMQLA